MSTRRGFQLHPAAANDITEIWEFIAVEDPAAARRVREDILETIRGLLRFPNRGHLRPDLTDLPLRFIRVFDFLIAYAPDEDPLWIIAVLHGRRDPSVLAAILRNREEQR